MRRLWLAVVAGSLLLTACIATSAPTITTTSQSVVAESTTSTAVGAVDTTSASLEVPSTSSTTSSSMPPTTTRVSGGYAPLGRVPVLEDGRPATFIAVTDDFRVVEVDTLTGSTLQTYNDAPPPEEDGDIHFNVYHAAWRSSDGAQLMVSSCCEPAAGLLELIDADGSLGDERTSGYFGWAAAPAVGADAWAVFGFSMDVVVPDGAESPRQVESQGASFAFGYPAWSRDLSRIYWLSSEPIEDALVTLSSWDGVSSDVERVPLPWLSEGDAQGLATQASGNLVLFAGADDGEMIGNVITPTGELVAEFPIEPQSNLGSYDASGTYLIYVDGEGNVRWQGGGGSGLLASGFVHASW